MWFAEISVLNRWRPTTFTQRPDIVSNGGVLRLKTISGVGPKLRADPVEVSKDHRKLTLTQLREVYSPDGRFQNA